LIALAEHVAETLDIGPGTRVFEVDCGDGAFLFPLHENGYIVGGIDGDPDAIAAAIAAMPDGIFQVGRAADLDPAVPWDVVICRSFSGLSAVALAKADAPDTDYMRGLLARMFAKATHAIAVLDVPEERRRWMLHALAEIGANAIQMEQPKIGAGADAGNVFNVFARV
jgi:trans-aconitate methyltransferase